MMTLPNQQETDFTIEDFRFDSGEVLPQLRQHAIIAGTPQRDASGQITNAVLLLHNTTGTSLSFLEEAVAGELFGPGQPLDASDHYLIIPDLIGFGRSSKPSDGLRANFPHYRYADMVRALHLLVTQGAGVAHLKLVMGLSMGGMLTWMLGIAHPNLMDALVPVASQPAAMSGRNWIQRRMNIEAIRNDPGWHGGNYTQPPIQWLLAAPIGPLMTQSVVRLSEMAPTRQAGDALYKQFIERARKGDANNRLYQLESSMDYDPSPDLDKIKARMLAINFADDELNPPGLGTLEAGIARIPGARSVTVPAGPQTQGHYTTMRPALWKEHLAGFLAEGVQ